MVKRDNYGVKKFSSLAQDAIEIYFSMLKEEIKEKATKLKDKESEFTHIELLSCAGTKFNFKDCFI